MISKRLQTIASLVPNGAIVADIGSDHALLPCYLVLENIAIKAYAVDNKKGPLNAAIENIEKYSLENKVFPSLSAGLETLADDVNTVVIAGMGYNTIQEILTNDLELAKKQDRIIIQCNNRLHLLRSFLFEYNFKVEEERFLIINDVEYTILAVKHSKDTFRKPNIYVSDYLINEKNELYLTYLRKRIKHLEDLKNYNEHFKKEYEEIIKYVMKNHYNN